MLRVACFHIFRERAVFFYEIEGLQQLKPEQEFVHPYCVISLLGGYSVGACEAIQEQTIDGVSALMFTESAILEKQTNLVFSHTLFYGGGCRMM